MRKWIETKRGKGYGERMRWLGVVFLLFWLPTVAVAEEEKRGEVGMFRPLDLDTKLFYPGQVEAILREKLAREEGNEKEVFRITGFIERVWASQVLDRSLELEGYLTEKEMAEFREEHGRWTEARGRAMEQEMADRSRASDYLFLAGRMEVSIKFLKRRVDELEDKIARKSNERTARFLDRMDKGEINLGPRIGPPRE